MHEPLKYNLEILIPTTRTENISKNKAEKFFKDTFYPKNIMLLTFILFVGLVWTRYTYTLAQDVAKTCKPTESYFSIEKTYTHQPFIIPLAEEQHFLTIWREESTKKLHFSLNPVMRRNGKLSQRDWEFIMSPSFQVHVKFWMEYIKKATFLPELFHKGLCYTDPDFCQEVFEIPMKEDGGKENIVILGDDKNEWLTFPSVFDENTWNIFMSNEIVSKINETFTKH